MYNVSLMKNDKCCQLGRMVAQARMFIIRSYLTYWYQVVVVLLVGVDGVVVAITADQVDLLVVVYPGIVGVDGTEVGPVLDPAEAVLPGGRDELPEGRVVSLVLLGGPPPPAEGPGQGEVFPIRWVVLGLAVRTWDVKI